MIEQYVELIIGITSLSKSHFEEMVNNGDIYIIMNYILAVISIVLVGLIFRIIYKIINMIGLENK